jgi:hypothetical protein
MIPIFRGRTLLDATYAGRRKCNRLQPVGSVGNIVDAEAALNDVVSESEENEYVENLKFHCPTPDCHIRSPFPASISARLLCGNHAPTESLQQSALRCAET